MADMISLAEAQERLFAVADPVTVERVPLRQWITTGRGALASTAAKASTSARVRVAAVTGMW